MTLAYLSTPLVGLVATGVIGQLGSAAMIGGVAARRGDLRRDLRLLQLPARRHHRLHRPGDRRRRPPGGAGHAPRRPRHRRARRRPASCSCRRRSAVVGLAALGADGEIAEAGARLLRRPRLVGALRASSTSWSTAGCSAAARPLTGLLLQTLLNGVGIALAFLLVLGLGWGVAGAGWAARRRRGGDRGRRRLAPRSPAPTGGAGASRETVNPAAAAADALGQRRHDDPLALAPRRPLLLHPAERGARRRHPRRQHHPAAPLLLRRRLPRRLRHRRRAARRPRRRRPLPPRLRPGRRPDHALGLRLRRRRHPGALR